MRNLNVLHVGYAIENGASGVQVVIPRILENQKEYCNVSFLNISSYKFSQVETFNYKEINSISNICNNYYVPDIVVFHEIYHYEYIKLYKECLQKQIPYIIIPHGGLSKIAQRHKFIKKIVGNKLLFEKFIKNCDAIQYLSKNELNNSIMKKRSFIIGNGIHNGNIDNLYNTAKNNHRLNLIYVGRYDVKIKGLDYLLKAFYENKDYMCKNDIFLKMYGTGEKEKLRRLIEKYKINNSVEVNGPIYHEEKIREIIKNDVFIQVSRTEGLPTGLIEAMSIGMPIIVSEGTGFNEIVDVNQCGTSCKNNSNSVFHAIKKMNDSKNTLKVYSQNSFDYANKQFNWSIIIKKNINEYISIINERKK